MRILYIEDANHFRDTVLYSIQRQRSLSAANIVAVPTYQQAVSLLENELFDGIVMNLQCHGSQEFKPVADFYKLVTGKKIPTVIFSGLVPESAMDELLLFGIHLSPDSVFEKTSTGNLAQPFLTLQERFSPSPSGRQVTSVSSVPSGMN